MDASKIRLTLNDDREVDFERPFAPPSDRIALERKFGVSSGTLGSPEAREEWVVFLIYRVAVRAVAEFASVSFDDFVDQLAGYEFVGGPSSVDPTEPDPPIG